MNKKHSRGPRRTYQPEEVKTIITSSSSFHLTGFVFPNFPKSFGILLLALKWSFQWFQINPSTANRKRAHLIGKVASSGRRSIWWRYHRILGYAYFSFIAWLSKPLSVAYSKIMKFWRLLTCFSAIFADTRISMDQIAQWQNYCLHLSVNGLKMMVLSSAVIWLPVCAIKTETKWQKHKMADFTFSVYTTHFKFFLQGFFSNPIFKKLIIGDRTLWN